jgi:hypothetical protein
MQQVPSMPDYSLASVEVTRQPVGLAMSLRSRQKSRLLPAATKLLSEKAPQATFSN